MSSPVHIELLDVTGNLGVHVDFLERKKFRRNLKGAGKTLALNFHYRDPGKVSRISRVGHVVVAATSRERRQKNHQGHRAVDGGFKVHDFSSLTFWLSMPIEKSWDRHNAISSLRLAASSKAFAGT